MNVAIPTLGHDLQASISTVQWVFTGYMLAFASVIPVAGWASERFGAKRVWLGALLLFMLGSALAGATWSIESLIGARVLQGLGAGMILPVGQLDPRSGRRPGADGSRDERLRGPNAARACRGADPRWCDRRAVELALDLLHQPPGRRGRSGSRLRSCCPRRGRSAVNGSTCVGLSLLSPGIALFLYGLAGAGDAGGLSDSRSLAAISVGLLLVALFVRHARARGDQALIDLSLFRRRAFAAAAAVNGLLGIALFGSLILLPLYYQLVRHESPVQVGLLLVPQAVGAALSMPVAGALTDRIGARLVVSAGLVVALLGTLAYTRIGVDTSNLYLAAALFVFGLGIGSTIMPSMAAAFQTLSREETPRATSALHAIQRIAGAIGTALFAIVLQRTVASNVPGFGGGIQGMSELSRRPHSTAELATAFGTTFWVAAALIVTGLVPALLLPRSARQQNQAASSAFSQYERRKAA